MSNFGVLVALWKVDNRKGYELAVSFSLLNSVSCARLDLLQLHSTYGSRDMKCQKMSNFGVLVALWKVDSFFLLPAQLKGFERFLAVCFILLNSVSCARLDLLQLHSTYGSRDMKCQKMSSFGVLVALWKVDNRKGYELAVCFSLLNSVSCARLDLLQLHSTVPTVPEIWNVKKCPNFGVLVALWKVDNRKGYETCSLF